MNNKIILNMVSSVFAYLITGITSLWIAPTIINKLGVEAYGLIPLIQMSINFMSIITISFTSMIARFYTVSKTKDRIEEAQEYLSTSFYCMIAVSIMMSIIIFILGNNIDVIINVPKELEVDARWLFITQGISFILLNLNITFQAIPYSKNKLYINNMSSTLSALARAILMILLLNFITPHIWYAGLSSMIGNLIALIIGVISYKILEPTLRLRFNNFKISKLKEMISLGLWQGVNYAGSLFYLQSDVMIANWNLGSIIAGEYSALIQWSSMIRAFGNALSSIFSPTYSRLYAKGKYKEIYIYSNKAIIIVGIIIGIMAGFLAGSGEYLLKVWIGENFINNSYLLVIIAISLSINVCISPLFALLTTYKKVKIPAIVQIIVGVFNFVFAYVITGPINMGILGLVIVSFISYSIINVIFMPIYISKIINGKVIGYYKSIFKSITCFFIGAIICNFTSKILNINSWSTLISSGIISSIIYSIIVFIFFIDKDDKLTIFNKINIKRTNLLRKNEV